MKKITCLIMLCLLAGAANNLAAQEVSVTNLQVASDNTITFNVSVGEPVEPVELWVFVDYFNMDKQQMWRLPISSARLTNSSDAGAKVRMIAGNNAGFYIEGSATSAVFTAGVSVTPYDTPITGGG